MHVYQLTAGFRRGDAISNEATLIAQLLAAQGCASSISAPRETTSPYDTHLVNDIRELPARVHPEDTALLHLSSGSPANEIFAALPCRKVILYHNITTHFFFERLDPATAKVLRDGISEVRKLARVTPHVYAVSSFNARELLALGFPEVEVFPLLLDADFAQTPPDTGRLKQLQETPLQKLLFVGRLVPNKRHDLLLSVFAHYQKYVNPASSLIISGGVDGAREYLTFLLATVRELGLRNVEFTGYVSDAELAACYAAADAFVCTSDHEGFCAPLLEAMAYHKPVFARAMGAIPETLDGAGILFSSDAPPAVCAETIGRVLSNPKLRAAVCAGQDARLNRFYQRNARAQLCAMLNIPESMP